ncbi:hypothetical protein [Thermococcus celer]|uniref:hypothetical protein n=1 Tax=Thermococcus celer TaxID=2264 RepID=UPI0012FF5E36|nr:hypothetical protein [Thermococcus celer]
MALGEVFLYYFYFGFNFLFIALLAYKIVTGKIPKKWRPLVESVLSLTTFMALLLVMGVTNETVVYLIALVFLVVTWKEEYERKLFGRLSKGLTRPILYLLVLFVISFAAVYWKTNLPVLAIPLGIIHLAYAGLVYYAHKTWEEGGMWRA